MAKVSNWRTLTKTDYDSKYQDLIETLATPLNQAMDEIYNNLDNNLDFTNNINATIATVTVAVDDQGDARNVVRFKLKANQKVVQGIIAIALKDNTSNNLLPNSGVFVSATQNGNLMTVQNIKGLNQDTSYNVTLLCL